MGRDQRLVDDVLGLRERLVPTLLVLGEFPDGHIQGVGGALEAAVADHSLVGHHEHVERPEGDRVHQALRLEVGEGRVALRDGDLVGAELLLLRRGGGSLRQALLLGQTLVGDQAVEQRSRLAHLRPTDGLAGLGGCLVRGVLLGGNALGFTLGGHFWLLNLSRFLAGLSTSDVCLYNITIVFECQQV